MSRTLHVHTIAGTQLTGPGRSTLLVCFPFSLLQQQTCGIRIFLPLFSFPRISRMIWNGVAETAGVSCAAFLRTPFRGERASERRRERMHSSSLFTAFSRLFSTVCPFFVFLRRYWWGRRWRDPSLCMYRVLGSEVRSGRHSCLVPWTEAPEYASGLDGRSDPLGDRIVSIFGILFPFAPYLAGRSLASFVSCNVILSVSCFGVECDWRAGGCVVLGRIRHNPDNLSPSRKEN